MKPRYKYFAAASISIALALTQFSQVQAHDGRRFEIVVINNQIYAQGYLSGENPTDDGGMVVRPYLNAIHGHFAEPVPGVYVATLPGFNLFDYQPFEGHDVMIELLGVQKWVAPIVGAKPDLIPLDSGEIVGAGFETQPSIDSDNLGSFTLIESVSSNAPTLDIDLSYGINFDPDDTLYVLQWRISTDAPGIAASESVYTILSPPGVGPVERLHFQSLGLEAALGIQADNIGPACMLGDVNLDSVVDFADIAPFVGLLAAGGDAFQCEADVNEDGLFNFADIAPFVMILASP